MAPDNTARGATTGRTNAVDASVGKRIRLRRTALGMSQEKLAEALGLTFQQVQKYEKGANRVGASRLFDLARVLGVAVEFFFEDLDPPPPPAVTNPATGVLAELMGGQTTLNRETLDLIQAYSTIRNPVVRRRVYDLARALADN
ncbi:MAG: helix-turn-helix domain-containing protein [Bacteroidales bacterium]